MRRVFWATIVGLLIIAGPVQAQLSGTFVIGSSGGADYATFNAAVTDMEAQGLNGDIIFEIEDGTYLEQVEVHGPDIAGSSTFSITFRGQNMDRSLVTLTYNANTIALDHTIDFENIDNITLEHITFENTTAGALSKVMDLIDASFVTIDNCRFVSTVASSISTDQSCLDITNNSSDVTVTNSRFDNGSFGISYANGSDAIIRGNDFHDQFFEGINTRTTNSMLIESNFIENGGTSSALYKAMNINLTNDFVLNRNRAVLGSGAFGMLIQATQVVDSTANLISNNHIHVNSVVETQGAIFFGAESIDFINNTVVVTSGGANLNLDLLINSNIFNNVFLNFDSENVYTGNSLSPTFVNADFNNVYSNGFVTPDDSLLSEHIASTGLDANSVSFEIMLSDPDLPDLCHYGMNGTATVRPRVTVDFYGTPRDATNPDIGAYEFSLPTPVILPFNQTTICEGDSVLIQAQPFVSYLWPDGSTNDFIYAKADSTYVLEVVDGIGCLLIDSVNVDLQSVSVDLGPDQTICSGNAVTLDAGAGFNSYLWSTGETTQTISATLEQDYTVTVQDNLGCSATDTVAVIFAASNITPNFLVVSQACVADTLQFLEFSDVIPDAVSWDFGDGATSTEQHPTHIYADSGQFVVTLTVSLGDCLNKQIQKTVDIDDCGLNLRSVQFSEVAPPEINLYPNPSQGEVNFHLQKPANQKASATVYDLSGRILYFEEFSDETEIKRVMDLTFLEDGIYIVRAKVGREVLTRRVIIDH